VVPPQVKTRSNRPRSNGQQCVSYPADVRQRHLHGKQSCTSAARLIAKRRSAGRQLNEIMEVFQFTGSYQHPDESFPRPQSRLPVRLTQHHGAGRQGIAKTPNYFKPRLLFQDEWRNCPRPQQLNLRHPFTTIQTPGGPDYQRMNHETCPPAQQPNHIPLLCQGI